MTQAISRIGRNRTKLTATHVNHGCFHNSIFGAWFRHRLWVVYSGKTTGNLYFSVQKTRVVVKSNKTRSWMMVNVTEDYCQTVVSWTPSAVSLLCIQLYWNYRIKFFLLKFCRIFFCIFLFLIGKIFLFLNHPKFPFQYFKQFKNEQKTITDVSAYSKIFSTFESVKWQHCLTFAEHHIHTLIIDLH